MVGAIDSRAVMLLLSTVVEWLIQNKLRLADESCRNTKNYFLCMALFTKDKNKVRKINYLWSNLTLTTTLAKEKKHC